MRVRGMSIVDHLQSLQFSHTKLGQHKGTLPPPKSRGGAKLSPVKQTKKAEAKSAEPEPSQVVVPRKPDVGNQDKVINGRPATAPTRQGGDLLEGFDFDRTLPRPWTANAVEEAGGKDKHVRLGDLVQLDGDLDDYARKVVEKSTKSQLKDSGKVYRGLLQMIPTAYTVNIKAGADVPLVCSAKPKPSKFNVKQRLTGGLVIIMDPSSNLEEKLCSIKVEHKLGRILASDEYKAVGTGNTFNLELSTEIAADYDEDKAHHGKKQSFPGWEGRPPIWIPTTQCRITVTTRSMPSRVSRRVSSDGESFTALGVGSKFSLPKAPMSVSLLIFSASSPKGAILYLRSLLQKLWRGTVEHLTVGGGIPAVNIAALHGNKGTVNELLTSGANPNARRDPCSDYTPLHEAVMGSHASVITNLLQMGANQFLCDVRGNTALHVACLNDDIECIRALLSDPSTAIIRRSLNAENRKRLKPHQVCSQMYCKLAVEHVMEGYNLAVCKPRVPLSEGG